MGVIRKFKVTPILFVASIEASLSFWEARLGFTRTIELPTGNKLGFVILTHGDTEIMLQTRESVEGDLPELAGLAEPRGGIYIEVDDFRDLLKRLEGVHTVVPVRDTPYGMTEIIVREPGGNTIAFAGKTEERGT